MDTIYNLSEMYWLYRNGSPVLRSPDKQRVMDQFNQDQINYPEADLEVVYTEQRRDSLIFREGKKAFADFGMNKRKFNDA